MTSSAARVQAEVDPEGHEVTSCEVEYGIASLSSSESCETLPGAGSTLVKVTAHLAGLKPGTKYRFRFKAVSAAGFESGATWSFLTLPPAPAVSTGTASAIGETSATLGGTADPNGLLITACRFEYGTTEAYGSTVDCSGEPGSGESPRPVSAALTGLTPGQSYHYRLVATNSSGTSYGQDAQFEAAPALLPEFGVCAPAVGRTGGYSEEGCVKPVAGSSGKYSWQPWPAGPDGAGAAASAARSRSKRLRATA